VIMKSHYEMLVGESRCDEKTGAFGSDGRRDSNGLKAQQHGAWGFSPTLV
jgi:hypothetical protein